MYYCPYICLCFIWTQQSDYLLCYHSFGKTIITIFNIVVVVACGVIATILVVLCLFWVGLLDNADIHTQGTTKTFNLATFPVAIGLYGYCYAGHAVFPNLYTAMANRNQFPGVLLVW